MQFGKGIRGAKHVYYIIYYVFLFYVDGRYLNNKNIILSICMNGKKRKKNRNFFAYLPMCMYNIIITFINNIIT